MMIFACFLAFYGMICAVICGHEIEAPPGQGHSSRYLALSLALFAAALAASYVAGKP